MGTFRVMDTDPLVTGVGADSSSEEGAFDNAGRKARETLDGTS